MVEKNFYWCKLFPYPILNAIARLHWCYFSVTSLNLHFRWRSICFQGHMQCLTTYVKPEAFNLCKTYKGFNLQPLIHIICFWTTIKSPSLHIVVKFYNPYKLYWLFFYLFQTKTHLTNYRLLVFISCIYRGGGGYSWTFLHMFKVTYWSLTFRARFQL